MAKNHTQAQRKALLLLRARLDPNHPMFAGSEAVKAALHGEAKPYFDTYVLPVLDYLLNGEAYYGQAADIGRDFSNREAAAESRQRAIASGMMQG